MEINGVRVPGLEVCMEFIRTQTHTHISERSKRCLDLLGRQFPSRLVYFSYYVLVYFSCYASLMCVCVCAYVCVCDAFYISASEGRHYLIYADWSSYEGDFLHGVRCLFSCLGPEYTLVLLSPRERERERERRRESERARRDRGSAPARARAREIISNGNIL